MTDAERPIEPARPSLPEQPPATEQAPQLPQPPLPPVPPTPPAPPVGVPPQAAPQTPIPYGSAPDATPAPKAALPSWLDARALGFAAIGGAVAIGFALAAAIVVALLTLLLTLVSGGDLSDLGGTEVTGVSVVAAIVWLAVLGLAGQLSLGANLFGASASAWASFVPVLVFLAAIAGAAWWAYRLERTAAATRSTRWPGAAAAGLAAGLASLLVSLAGIVSASGEIAGLGDLGAVAVSTFAVGTFFGPLVIVGLATVFGRWVAQGGDAPFVRALLRLPARLRPWGRDLYDYVAALAVLFVPASVIVALVAGEGGLGVWPIAVGQLTVAAIAIGHLGGYATSASMTQYGGTETTAALVAGTTTGWAWLLLLLALIAAAAASVLIAARRATAPVPLQRAWVLPVSVLVLSLIGGLILGGGQISGGFSALGMTVSFAAGAGVAWWTYLLALVWGAGVEALVRFAAPLALASVPALGRLRLGPVWTPPAAASGVEG